MLYYGVFIPGKTNFEGSIESCPGSVAAVNFHPLVVQTSTSGSPISCDEQLLKEDPEYPVDSPDWLVFVEKSKALDLLRQYKEARLREFPNLEQAERYVQFGFESVQSMKLFAKVKKPSTSSSSHNNSSSGTPSGSPIQNKTNNITAKTSSSSSSSSSNSSSTISNGNDVPTASSTLSKICANLPAALSITANSAATDTPAAPAMASAERPPFRAPTKQELVEFRKTIESGDCTRVGLYVWDNPRYLISCGDTPTSLKEGYRYNSIHICAQFNQPLIAEMLLKVVSDRRFAYLYTGKRANPNMCAALNSNLLDYYLNMPDKGRSETPLHFASKNGHWQVVAVLVSYPECKSLPNKDGQLPKDIICQRARVSDPEVFEKIKLLLTERFYVPVLRAVDQTMPPKIGQPFSSSNPPHALVQKDQPNDDPFSPNYKIKALAGPMNKNQADKFCRRWKTPPRPCNNMSINPSSPAIINNVYISPLKSPYPLFSSPMYKSMMKPQRRRVLFSPNMQENPLKILERNDEDAATWAHGEENNQLTADSHHHVANMVNGLKIDNTEHIVDKQNGNYTKTQHQQQKQQSNQEEQEQQLKDQDHKEQPSQSGSGSERSDAIMDVTFKIETNNNDTNDEESTTSVTINSQTHYEKYGTIAFPYTPSKQQYRDVLSATSLGNDSATINCQYDDWMTVTNDSFKERHIKNTDFEKGLESIGRQLAKQENINWIEYWDFLDAFVDITQPGGLQKLEQYFAKRIETINLLKKPKHSSPLNDLCNALARAGLSGYNKSSNCTPVSATSSHTTKHHHQIGTSHWAQLCSNFTISPVPPPTPTTTTNSIADSAAAAELLLITNPVPQVNTPYTCVEKSLQVFAKRMTKTIINNINNVVSINDTLLSELKRLKSLISSFKEDARFYSVDFSKVHSRIGNLVATYIANSNEVMLAIKLKIQSVLRDLLASSRERREHMECVCTYMLQMLEQSSNLLPDNLKTEEMCSSTWAVEKSCECQWDGNLSRKTSRRKRTESLLYGQKQHETKESSSSIDNIEMMKNNSYVKPASTTGDAAAAMSVVLPIATSSHWHSNHFKSNNMDEDGDNVANEENIWWDCGSETETEVYGDSDYDDDDDDCYETPPESLSPQPSMEDLQCYNVYILGDVPTKRDLDVLNALSTVKIDKERYPCICSWKEALTGFSVQEMDLFPSPSKIVSTESSAKEEQRERADETPKKCTKVEGGRLKSAFESTILAQIAGKGKRLFSTPKLSSATMNLRTEAVTNAANAANAAIGAIKAATTATATTTPISNNRFGSFKTPLFKMRGLFSQYRETSKNDSDDDDDDNDVGGGGGHKIGDICDLSKIDSNDLNNDSLQLQNC